MVERRDGPSWLRDDDDDDGSSLEVCQNFQEVLSTFRSVGVAHWARDVASDLGVCLQA